MKRDLFISGTDTGVGKTVLSALLVAALRRQYWKPVQTGSIEGTDRETVMKLARVDQQQTFPESYIFDAPVSPHLAASLQGTVIDLGRIRRPESSGSLVIEGAGGLMVPINDESFMIDLMRQLDIPIIVAARTALGTINHTLLTVNAIRDARLDLRGVVMIGKENADNRRAVERYGNVPVVGFIPWLESIDGAALRSVFQRHFDQSAFL